ncbi:MAG: hypothetical protein ACFFC7_05965 [Candidatus Hermodarchaeota archaeon]
MRIIRYLMFFIKNKNYLKIFQQIGQVQSTLTLVNMEIGKLGYRNPIYNQRVSEFNQAIIDLTKAKWYSTRAMETSSKNYWNKAFQSIGKSKELAQKIYGLLSVGDATPIAYEKATITSNGTEISFADGVPLVPEVCPVVILKGSDYEMGYQYAQQLIQIFGSWILEQKANRNFSETQRNQIREWEKQIQDYAPEILDMCKGWGDGATEAGVPMSYNDVLELWTGRLAPANYYFGMSEWLPELPPLACSGAAAWGRATVDGRLVTGSTGDHDCTYMVTIVAFPETGNNFIYTVFGATGDVPLVGPTFLMGHPGMNSKGLAYVEHGGMPRFVEPRQHWGYGIRLGTSIFHILRFANNAEEAREMELSYPVGDVGRHGFGSVGGFYSDSNYGYILESRKDPIVIREAGVMGETDFLYANNSAIHPESGKAEWLQENKENWTWDEHGGWHPKEYQSFRLFGSRSPDNKFLSAQSHTYNNSYGRNLYLYRMLSQNVGQIDFEYMKKIYQKSGTLPMGTWEEIASNYKRSGQWGEYSTAHPGNALVGIMKPEEGRYALCTGPAKRGLVPMAMRPTGSMIVSGNPIYNETNAFWELKLAAEPEQVMMAAKRQAQEDLNRASAELVNIKKLNVVYEALEELLTVAQNEFKNAEGHKDAAKKTTGNQSIYSLSRALRAFTRAQIRARQVYNALNPSERCAIDCDPSLGNN